MKKSVGILFLIVLMIIPVTTIFAEDDDYDDSLEEDIEQICEYYHGEIKNGECELENENLRDEYEDYVAYAEDAHVIENREDD